MFHRPGRSTRGAVFRCLTALLALALVAVIESNAAAKVSQRAPATHAPRWKPTAKNLQSLLGRHTRLRDFAAFTTERGEPAALLLSVRHARQISRVEEVVEEGACAGVPCDEGLVYLDGDYSLILVINGRVINSVALEMTSLPLLKAKDPSWGPERGRPRPDELERVKLIQLADYNGDGNDWEFTFTRHESWSLVSMMMAGYRPRRRKAVVFPIVSGTTREFWKEALFQFQGNRFRFHAPCGFLGNPTQTTEEFTYDAVEEAWLRTRLETRECDAVDGLGHGFSSPDVLIKVEHSDEARIAGSITTIDVLVETKHSDVRLVMMDFMVDPQLTIPPDTDGRPSCRTASDRGATFWFYPPRCVSPEEGPGCQPATEIGMSIPVELSPDAYIRLFRCDVRIDPKALSGRYPVWATKVRAYDSEGRTLSVYGSNDITDFVNVCPP